MQMRPTIGAVPQGVQTCHRLDSVRWSPSAYPMGRTPIRLGRAVRMRFPPPEGILRLYPGYG